MKLHTAPQDEAILSNVAEIGEFRIRNSAKAFNILSSGLYANKIRAVIRELSCNAVDSHAAAGKKDTPFDVHLPNTLEPWFSIRDYGTGLNHEQVTNIYTTYFESTKTASNEFIGALGLGSKSPFSYTDNFTVTAIKDGIKGVYSAFINDQGVPSIALMMSEESTEPNGVEVKFSVNDRYDFRKFEDEAYYVYTWFKLQPVVTGCHNFTFRTVEYDVENIVPGVHTYKGGSPHGCRSVAIMGNIAYPIEVPNPIENLGKLQVLLSCGLEINFGIGELDFQASREGLSYIPQTIESIKAKLEAVNAALAGVLAKEAEAIPDLWDRALFLYQKNGSYLWSEAVKKYAVDSKLVTLDPTTNIHYLTPTTFKLTPQVLAKKYNIDITGFDFNANYKGATTLKVDSEYSEKKKNAAGNYDIIHYWGIKVSSDVHFVINDTNIGATERAKYHYRESKEHKRACVFVLNKVDKTKDMKVDAFLKAIRFTKQQFVHNVSDFMKKDRNPSGVGKNVTLLKLEERGYGGYYRQQELVWKDAGTISQFDDNTTFYYMPLSGFTPESITGEYFDVKRLCDNLHDCGIPSLRVTIYGVRKGDIEAIKAKKNWVNVETFIEQELRKPINDKIVMSMVLDDIDKYRNVRYNSNVLNNIKEDKSPYQVFTKKLKGFEKIRYDERALTRLCNDYAKDVTYSPKAQVDVLVAECKEVAECYPLLAYMHNVPDNVLADYINMIDTQKGV